MSTIIREGMVLTVTSYLKQPISTYIALRDFDIIEVFEAIGTELAIKDTSDGLGDSQEVAKRNIRLMDHLVIIGYLDIVIPDTAAMH